MLWVLLGLICIETAVVHFLVALWSGRAALLLSILGLATLVWMVRFIRSLRHCPVRVELDSLVWPCGSWRTLTVPVDAIAGIRQEWDAGLLKSGTVFNGALVAYPNMLVALNRPLPMGRRRIFWLAHRLDDPQAFAAALARLMGEA